MASNLLVACEDGRSPLPDDSKQTQTTIIHQSPHQNPERDPERDAAAVEAQAEESLPRPDHFAYCYSGYRTTGRAELDVLRLGALCGPSNGMQALQPRWRPELAEEDPSRLVEVEAGDCVRAVAAVSEAGAEFELEWREGPELRAGCIHRGHGWCPADGILCSQRRTTYELVLRAEQQLPQFVAQIWLRSTSSSTRKAKPE